MLRAERNILRTNHCSRLGARTLRDHNDGGSGSPGTDDVFRELAIADHTEPATCADLGAALALVSILYLSHDKTVTMRRAGQHLYTQTISGNKAHGSSLPADTSNVINLCIIIDTDSFHQQKEMRTCKS